MTAIIALRLPDRIEIASDTAVYDQQQIVRGFECKIERMPSGKGVMTGRGLSRTLDLFLEYTSELAERTSSYDLFIAALRSGAEAFRENVARISRAKRDNIKPFQVMFAGLSEQEGPVIYTFSNIDEGDLKAFELNNVPFGVAFGNSLSAAEHRRMLNLGGLKTIASRFFDGARNDPARDLASMVVGGQIDFTVIDQDGISIETVHSWDDVVGQRITSMEAFLSNMNRQQRRQWEREQRKSAKVA